MATPSDLRDVYTELQEFADRLWDVSQSSATDSAGSQKAVALYNTLENKYLEPIRRKMYQADDVALAAAAFQLNVSTQGISHTIDDLANIVQTTDQIDQFVKVFDQVLATAAKVLAVVG